jgi:signal transduction histidine kinase
MKSHRLPLEVAPRAILALGEDLVRDDRAALEELVKNAYDADARNVRVVFEVVAGHTCAIRIVDDGSGMSLADIKSKWLVVATPNKLEKNQSAGGRILAGQKGIGRLSAARLGSTLEMATRTLNGQALLLTLDWNDLERVQKLSDFLVNIDEDARGVAALGVGASGTTIRISNLRREWAVEEATGSDLDDIEQALSRTINPFAPQTGVRLTLAVESDDQVERELGPPDFIEHPNYLFKGHVFSDGTVRAEYNYSRTPRHRTILMPSVKYPGPLSVKACGPFSFEIRAWDRDQAILIDTATRAGLDIEVKDIRKVLNEANGLFVYRDNILAYPKRADDRDWLGLEARRVDNPSQRLGMSHIVAAAFVSRNTNQELKDKSDREGLVDNVALRQFRTALEGLLGTLETERALDKPPMGKAKTAHAEIQIDTLAGVAKNLRQGTVEPKEVASLIEDEAERLKLARDVLKTRLAVLGRLAAVGQLAGVLVHEISHNLPVLGESLKRLATTPAIGTPTASAMLQAAHNAVRSIQRVVQRFTPFFIGGIRTRLKVSDLAAVVDAAVQTRAKAIAESSVQVRTAVPDGLSMRIDAGDALAVVANLLDNALYWCTLGKKPHAISLRAKRDDLGIRLAVADSGPGIDDEVLSRVFDAGFTTRAGGMGLGLSIAKDVLDAHGGRIEAEGTSALGGAKLVVHFPPEPK